MGTNLLHFGDCALGLRSHCVSVAGSAGLRRHNPSHVSPFRAGRHGHHLPSRPPLPGRLPHVQGGKQETNGGTRGGLAPAGMSDRVRQSGVSCRISFLFWCVS